MLLVRVKRAQGKRMVCLRPSTEDIAPLRIAAADSFAERSGRPGNTVAVSNAGQSVMESARHDP